MSFFGMDDYGEMGVTLDNYTVFFQEPVYWLTFVRTVGYSLAVTFLVLLIGLPVAFYITNVTLVIIARLKKFDRSLEEAAYNLGANRFEVIWYITLPFLRPAIIGGAAVAFLLSFENFNTTLFLVGSNATLPITLFTQIKDGSTPIVNAVSLILILGVSTIALLNFIVSLRSSDTNGA